MGCVCELIQITYQDKICVVPTIQAKLTHSFKIFSLQSNIFSRGTMPELLIGELIIISIRVRMNINITMITIKIIVTIKFRKKVRPKHISWNCSTPYQGPCWR